MKLYDLVKKILEKQPRARSSDKHLIWMVMTYKAGKTGSFHISLQDFLNCQSFESITRARRKVQENHPELKASSVVEKARKVKEQTKGMFVYHVKS